ncbi:hypothetical protein ACFVH6_08115 [Spirillospora sp. NPDC127200]
MGEEHVRIPTATLLRVWETISGAMAEAGGGARAMELWRPGRLGVTRDGEGVTVTWNGPYQEHPSFPLIAEFVPAMLLGVAGSGAGSHRCGYGCPTARRPGTTCWPRRTAPGASSSGRARLR